jgi:hypothetical protein
MCIFGGSDLEFIDFYCNEALKISLDETNKKIISSTYFKYHFTPACIIEQYYLGLLAQIFDKKIDILDINWTKADWDFIEILKLQKKIFIWESYYRKDFDKFLDYFLKKIN